MNTTRQTTIGGIEFEAVRFNKPCPHWKAKVVATGKIMAQGYTTRPKMWQQLEHFRSLRPDSFASESLACP